MKLFSLTALTVILAVTSRTYGEPLLGGLLGGGSSGGLLGGLLGGGSSSGSVSVSSGGGGLLGSFVGGLTGSGTSGTVTIGGLNMGTSMISLQDSKGDYVTHVTENTFPQEIKNLFNQYGGKLILKSAGGSNILVTDLNGKTLSTISNQQLANQLGQFGGVLTMQRSKLGQVNNSAGQLVTAILDTSGNLLQTVDPSKIKQVTVNGIQTVSFLGADKYVNFDINILGNLLGSIVGVVGSLVSGLLGAVGGLLGGLTGGLLGGSTGSIGGVIIGGNNPGTSIPGTTDPGSTNPGTSNPGTTEPGTSNPGTTNPGTTNPGTTNPGTTNPGTTNPGTTNPGTTNPGTTDPGTTNPGTTNPGTTNPGTTNPGNTFGGLNPGDTVVSVQDKIGNFVQHFPSNKWSTITPLFEKFGNALSMVPISPDTAAVLNGSGQQVSTVKSPELINFINTLGGKATFTLNKINKVPDNNGNLVWGIQAPNGSILQFLNPNSIQWLQTPTGQFPSFGGSPQYVNFNPNGVFGIVNSLMQLVGNVVSTGQQVINTVWNIIPNIGTSLINWSLIGNPGTTIPGTTYPGTTYPGTTYPGTTYPGTTNPGSTNPGTTYPGTTYPGTTYPGTTNPGTTNPGSTNPGTTYPGTTNPGSTYPGTTNPGTTYPGTTYPGTTYPGTTYPGTTYPGTTYPGTTYPGTTYPGSTTPGTGNTNIVIDPSQNTIGNIPLGSAIVSILNPNNEIISHIPLSSLPIMDVLFNKYGPQLTLKPTSTGTVGIYNPSGQLVAESTDPNLVALIKSNPSPITFVKNVLGKITDSKGNNVFAVLTSSGQPVQTLTQAVMQFNPLVSGQIPIFGGTVSMPSNLNLWNIFGQLTANAPTLGVNPSIMPSIINTVQNGDYLVSAKAPSGKYIQHIPMAAVPFFFALYEKYGDQLNFINADANTVSISDKTGQIVGKITNPNLASMVESVGGNMILYMNKFGETTDSTGKKAYAVIDMNGNPKQILDLQNIKTISGPEGFYPVFNGDSATTFTINPQNFWGIVKQALGNIQVSVANVLSNLKPIAKVATIRDSSGTIVGHVPLSDHSAIADVLTKFHNSAQLSLKPNGVCTISSQDGSVSVDLTDPGLAALLSKTGGSATVDINSLCSATDIKGSTVMVILDSKNQLVDFVTGNHINQITYDNMTLYTIGDAKGLLSSAIPSLVKVIEFMVPNVDIHQIIQGHMANLNQIMTINGPTFSFTTNGNANIQWPSSTITNGNMIIGGVGMMPGQVTMG